MMMMFILHSLSGSTVGLSCDEPSDMAWDQMMGPLGTRYIESLIPECYHFLLLWFLGSLVRSHHMCAVIV